MIDLNQLQDEQSSSLQEAMTPMIDVIFVLIAFMMLMINAPLMTMEVDLPKTPEKPAATTLQKEQVIIALLPNDELWYLGDTSYATDEALKAALSQAKAEQSELSVVVQSDKTVPMERVVRLFALLQALELNVTHLALKE